MVTFILLYLLIGSVFVNIGQLNGVHINGLELVEGIIAWPYHLYQAWRS